MKKIIQQIKTLLEKVYCFISAEDSAESGSYTNNSHFHKRETGILVAIIVVLLFSYMTLMDETDGREWEQDRTGRYYIGENGKRLIGWHEFDGLTYHFNAYGIMDTGLIEIDGSYYYLGSDGVMRSRGFHKLSDKHYYFGVDGRAVTGWLDLDGIRYHFDENGVMNTGLIKMEEGTYYFGDDGIMRTNGFHTVKKDQYYLDNDGRAVSGWLELDGLQYHFNEDGAMDIGLVRIGDYTYSFGENGAMRTNTFQQIKDDWYYFNENGQAVTGWFNLDGQGYRRFSDDGVMQTGWRIEDGQKVSYFGDDGILRTGFHEFEGEGIRYFDNAGIMQTGLLKIKTSHYYFNDDGIMLTGYHIIDGTHYYFDRFGKLTEHEQNLDGIVTEDGIMYYYENGKKTYAGLIKIDNSYYYVNSHCQVVTGTYTIKKTNDLLPEGVYEFDKNGRLMPAEYAADGIVTENGIMYYYENGKKTYAGLINIYEDFYYVNTACKVVTGSYKISKTNGLLLSGEYEFGEDGKMVIEEPVKNGLVQEEIGLFYYDAGILSHARLIYDEQTNGYYYIKSNGEAATGKRTIYESQTNMLLPPGDYEFGSDGKMLIDNIIREGLVQENDGLYYYKDKRLTHAGLIYDKKTNGYYYINSSGKVVTGTYTIYESRANGLLPAGTYDFGEDGKLTIAIPPKSTLKKSKTTNTQAEYQYLFKA